MTKALIVGGGLGGLHAALALRRAGVDCVVLEKAAELRQIQVGIGMVLWPNGMNALRGVGLMNAVARTGARVDRITFDSHAGARLNSWPVGTLARRLGAPATAIDRASLHRVLARELDPGVLRLGSRVTAVEDDGNGVRVQMEDGADERGDVLIGADGARSAVRPQFSGKHVAFPPYAGYTLWHAIIPTPPARPDVEAGTFALTLGVGLRFVSFSVDRRRTYWCALATEPAGGREPRNTRRQKLLDMYADFPAEVRDLVAATDDTAVRRIDIYGGEPLSAWGSGRVTLLGDAAHPMTTILGQGACMALEDGAALARHLRGTANPVDALRAYEAERIDRTTRVLRLIARFNPSGEGHNRAKVRNQLIRHAFRRGPGGRLEALISEPFEHRDVALA